MREEAASQPNGADAQRDEGNLLNSRADFGALMQTGNQIRHCHINHAGCGQPQQRGDEVVHVLQHEIGRQSPEQSGGAGKKIKEKCLPASIARIEQDQKITGFLRDFMGDYRKDVTMPNCTSP